MAFKVCSHLTFASAFVSTSPSKFNIASMETQTQTHRMGLNQFLTFYIDVDANANSNVRCEHTFMANCVVHREFLWPNVPNKFTANQNWFISSFMTCNTHVQGFSA